MLCEYKKNKIQFEKLNFQFIQLYKGTFIITFFICYYMHLMHHYIMSIRDVIF